MTLSKTAVRGAVATIGGQWLKFMIQTLGIVILSRLLTPDDFGLYAMVMAVVGIALLLGDFGLSLASIQAEEVNGAERTNIFWTNVLIGLVSATVVFFAADLIADFYDAPELANVVRLLSTVFILQAAKAQFAANASRDFRFKLLAWVDVGSQGLALTAAVTGAVLGIGVWSLVLQQLVAAAAALVWLTLASTWHPGLPRRRTSIRRFVAFGTNTMGVQVVNYVSANIDSVLLGRSFGSFDVGLYDRAYQLFRLPLQQIAAPMTRVALPVLSRVSDPRLFESYIVRAQMILTYGLGGAFAVAVAVAYPLLELVLGPGWGLTPLLFSILAVGGIFQTMGYVYYWIFLAKNKTALQLKFSVITRLFMIGLIVLGLRWGVVGVATAVAAGLAVNWLVLSIWAVPRAGIPTKALVLCAARPLTIFAVMVVVARGAAHLLETYLGPVLELTALLGVCALVVALAVAAVPAVRRDLRSVVSTLRKGLRR
ncbi:lipopolysaccharide biosynthesis protein [Sanguibacter antarcticus]|uniref:PST family polysaccharide transporter n=1 Tax=Sanguibacter antarcticus TaxID=372484 RepID=A0A2A9E3N2_9MICO|nr:lipopolysaccharide biosynthesis protein [Sanguibacter antarcticus]PFG33181.1 PST family polysaccharide transporter [Sanguibacter antarcticus]